MKRCAILLSLLLLHFSLFPVALSEPAATTLRLNGCFSDAIYQSFHQEHPEVEVSFSDAMPTALEVAQAIITQDATYDLYAVWVDYNFTQLVEKHYAADLSSSSLLTEDVATMYPNFRQMLTNSAGQLIAYPFQVFRSDWLVNPSAWQMVFGDKPLPATFQAFFEDMLLWETDYADEYGDLIAFAGDFDFAYWARTTVNAFVCQHWQTDTPLSLNDEHLRAALSALEQVRDVRQQKGRNISFDPENFFPMVSLIDDAGYNIALQNPPSEQLTDDIEAMMNSYAPFSVPTFSDDEACSTPGRMIVWFVNPYTQHKELAIRYLEHAAMKNNNLQTYYATHPDATEPMASSSFETRLAQFEQQRADLQELLAAADESERRDIEMELATVQAWLDNVDSWRWNISPDAIEYTHSYAGSLVFDAENPYLQVLGDYTEARLESLYQRYQSGKLDAERFLKALEQLLIMIHEE